VSRRGERIALALSVGLVFFGGYFAIGLGVDPARARSLGTPLDDAIPFVPVSVVAYALVYTMMTLPIFVVRCEPLFRRVALGYLAVVIVSLGWFLAMPVTSAGLRADLTTLDPARFTSWGLRLLYAWDPPLNLFPSAHLAVATLAALVAWQVRRAYGVLAFGMLLPVALSISTVKQHYVVDGVAGAALAAACWAVLVRPHRTPADAAYGWAGPAAFVLLNALVYWGLYLAFLAGTTPWAS